MQTTDRFKIAALAMALAFTLAACEQQGPAEEAGEKVDTAVEETQEAVGEVTESVTETVEEASEQTGSGN
jgi:hypothetical protein